MHRQNVGKYWLVLFLFWGLSATGQDFHVSEKLTFTGGIGEEIEGSIVITNTTDEILQLGIKRVDATIGTSQKTWFCVNDECERTDAGSILRFDIAPGESFQGFRSYLESGLAEGYSVIRYQIYDRLNSTNEIEIEVNYNVEDSERSTAIFMSKQLIINDVYPNPVSEFAIIDYAILDPETDAKIILHSLLGSVIGEYKLQPLETNLKINADGFNPGVYFYTLYVDNDGLMTRKLIVRK